MAGADWKRNLESKFVEKVPAKLYPNISLCMVMRLDVGSRCLVGPGPTEEVWAQETKAK